MFNEKKHCRRIKKDYHSKNLCNLFFSKNKKKISKKLTWLFVFLGLIFTILIIWFFFASSVWQIKNLKVEGLTRIDQAEIEKIINEQAQNSFLIFFKQTNIYLFDAEKARGDILADYNFSSLEIKKRLPKTLVIKVSERPYSFIFQQGSDYFYASQDAYIIPEAAVSEEDKEKYFILENKNNTNLINASNQINIGDNYLGFVLKLADYFNISQGLKVERFIIDVELNTVKVKCSSGPMVYFNTKNDPKEQLDRLVLVKNEKIKDNFSKTNYIDLRYGDKIFIN